MVKRNKLDLPNLSYSWHPEKNKIWVQRLAERLIQDGVNVKLDVWDLKHGHDKNA